MWSFGESFENVTNSFENCFGIPKHRILTLELTLMSNNKLISKPHDPTFKLKEEVTYEQICVILKVQENRLGSSIKEAIEFSQFNIERDLIGSEDHKKLTSRLVQLCNLNTKDIPTVLRKGKTFTYKTFCSILSLIVSTRNGTKKIQLGPDELNVWLESIKLIDSGINPLEKRGNVNEFLRLIKKNELYNDSTVELDEEWKLRRTFKISSNPFMGFQSYGINKGEYYSGRDVELKTCLDKLEELVWRKKGRTLFFYGPAGSGKSSFIFAGLLYSIIKDQDNVVFNRKHFNKFKKVKIIHFRPGKNPLKVLIEQLWHHFKDIIKDDLGHENTSELIEALKTDPKNLELFLPTKGPDDYLIIFYVDQFEELFVENSLSQKDENENERISLFINLLNIIANSSSCQTILLASYKIGFEKGLLRLNDQLFDGQLELFIFNEYEQNLIDKENFDISKVIEKPLAVLKEESFQVPEFGKELVVQLQKDFEEEASLALISFILYQLWETFGYQNTITLNDYKQLKQDLTLREQLDRQAEDSFNELSKENEEQEIAKTMFINLVHVEGQFNSKQSLKRDYLLSKYPDSVEFIDKVLNTFGSKVPLITFDDDNIELNHDTIPTFWERYKVWIDEHRVRKNKLGEVSVWYRKWADNNENSKWFPNEGVTKDYLENVFEVEDVLFKPEKHKKFLEKSNEHWEDKKHQEKQLLKDVQASGAEQVKINQKLNQTVSELKKTPKKIFTAAFIVGIMALTAFLIIEYIHPNKAKERRFNNAISASNRAIAFQDYSKAFRWAEYAYNLKPKNQISRSQLFSSFYSYGDQNSGTIAKQLFPLYIPVDGTNEFKIIDCGNESIIIYGGKSIYLITNNEVMHDVTLNDIQIIDAKIAFQRNDFNLTFLISSNLRKHKIVKCNSRLEVIDSFSIIGLHPCIGDSTYAYFDDSFSPIITLNIASHTNHRVEQPIPYSLLKNEKITSAKFGIGDQILAFQIERNEDSIQIVFQGVYDKKILFSKWIEPSGTNLEYFVVNYYGYFFPSEERMKYLYSFYDNFSYKSKFKGDSTFFGIHDFQSGEFKATIVNKYYWDDDWLYYQIDSTLHVVSLSDLSSQNSFPISEHEYIIDNESPIKVVKTAKKKESDIKYNLYLLDDKSQSWEHQVNFYCKDPLTFYPPYIFCENTASKKISLINPENDTEIGMLTMSSDYQKPIFANRYYAVFKEDSAIQVFQYHNDLDRLFCNSKPIYSNYSKFETNYLHSSFHNSNKEHIHEIYNLKNDSIFFLKTSSINNINKYGNVHRMHDYHPLSRTVSLDVRFGKSDQTDSLFIVRDETLIRKIPKTFTFKQNAYRTNQSKILNDSLLYFVHEYFPVYMNYHTGEIRRMEIPNKLMSRFKTDTKIQDIEINSEGYFRLDLYHDCSTDEFGNNICISERHEIVIADSKFNLIDSQFFSVILKGGTELVPDPKRSNYDEDDIRYGGRLRGLIIEDLNTHIRSEHLTLPINGNYYYIFDSTKTLNIYSLKSHGDLMLSKALQNGETPVFLAFNLKQLVTKNKDYINVYQIDEKRGRYNLINSISYKRPFNKIISINSHYLFIELDSEIVRVLWKPDDIINSFYNTNQPHLTQTELNENNIPYLDYRRKVEHY